MDSPPIKKIRTEIFRLAKLSEDMDIMQWYCSVDDCFENDEFQKNEASNLRWRLEALQMKKEPINHLCHLIEPVLIYHGFVSEDKKKWIGRNK